MRRKLKFEQIGGTKVDLHSIRFCFSLKKYPIFHPFYKSISAQPRQSHTGQKFSEKFFCNGYFEISLLSFLLKTFEQNFVYTVYLYLVRIWTYKNADETAHTFSRSKNVKKRRKNAYCVNSPQVLKKRSDCQYWAELHRVPM